MLVSQTLYSTSAACQPEPVCERESTLLRWITLDYLCALEWELDSCPYNDLTHKPLFCWSEMYTQTVLPLQAGIISDSLLISHTTLKPAKSYVSRCILLKCPELSDCPNYSPSGGVLTLPRCHQSALVRSHRLNERQQYMAVVISWTSVDDFWRELLTRFWFLWTILHLLVH